VKRSDAMGAYFDQLPGDVKNHLEEVTRHSGLPGGDESRELIAEAWVKKRDRFEAQIGSLHMKTVDTLTRDAPRGALLLTSSGSLISLGVTGAGGSQEGTRRAEYASIGIRRDVPSVAKSGDAVLEQDIRVGSPLRFRSGPVKQSSNLLRIAVCDETVSPGEQEKRIREATAYLTEEFLQINRTCFDFTASLPPKFTMRSMIAYAASRAGVTRKDAERVIGEFLDAVEKGVLTGNRVPLGTLGKLHLRKLSPQKARVGRNPATGAELTINAKPERMAPGFRFSKRLKEKVSSIDPDSVG
jgi:nucleoid DNA-binding protein